MGNRNKNIFKRKDGVSVVIPTYNRPDYLDRILKSILNQSKPVDEVIIVDDNSPDIEGYKHVIKKYENQLNITYLRMESNSGAPACRNRGIEYSKYRYIALTDDDDEWNSKKNELEYEMMQQHDIGLVYSHGIAIDDEGKELYRFKGKGRGNDLKALLKECFIPSSSVMVTYEAIQDAGLFDVRLPSCQDWDMWTRIICKGYSYEVICEPLLIYHKHNRSSIGKSSKATMGYKLFYRKHLTQYIKYFLFTREFKLCLHALKVAFLQQI